MPNTRIGGSRWVPDIRPDKIETVEEINGEESQQYRIVDAHPIIGGILDKLGYFRTHAGAVWYNKLAGTTVLQKLKEVDGMGSNISDAFSKEKEYEAGEYCIYLNRLYKFTEAKSAGEWDGAKVVPCTIGQELSSLNGDNAILLGQTTSSVTIQKNYDDYKLLFATAGSGFSYVSILVPCSVIKLKNESGYASTITGTTLTIRNFTESNFDLITTNENYPARVYGII